MSDQNPFQFSFQNLAETLEESASNLFEGITEAFVGKAETLRDGSEFEPVELPRDLYAHRNAQTEWWYYTGHAETSSGNRFGFELVFFKRRTDLDKFSFVPVRLLGNPIYFAHFAITDYQYNEFSYAHRKSSNGWFEHPATASEKHFHLRFGDWSLRESHGNHILRASVDQEITFEATLKPEKNVVLHGENKNGVSIKDKGEASRHFSYPRMGVEGDITRKGETEHFTGSAWMDREFGTWTPTEKQKGWDWFSIQLEDETELMLYQLRDETNDISPYSTGAFVDKNNNHTHLSNKEFAIEPTGFWKSPQTKTTYPSNWNIEVPKFDLSLSIIPIIEDQELDTRGTTMIIYWEGACKVIGKIAEKDITGNAYVELVGYDRSHENPNLAHFLWGGNLGFPDISFLSNRKETSD